MSETDKFILIHILKELSQYFSNLKLEKIKTGRKITHLKFIYISLKNGNIIVLIGMNNSKRIIRIEKILAGRALESKLYKIAKEFKKLISYKIKLLDITLI